MPGILDGPALEGQVLAVFERYVTPGTGISLSLNLNLRTDLNLDSITMVALLFDLEQVFGVSLITDDVDLSRLDTILDVAELVRQLCGNP